MMSVTMIYATAPICLSALPKQITHACERACMDSPMVVVITCVHLEHRAGIVIVHVAHVNDLKYVGVRAACACTHACTNLVNKLIITITITTYNGSMQFHVGLRLVPVVCAMFPIETVVMRAYMMIG